MKIVEKSDELREKNQEKVIDEIKPVVEDVKEEGMQAVSKYTQKFDEVNLNRFEVSEKSKKSALKSLSSNERKAISDSAERIKNFHRNQKPKEWEKEFEEGFTGGEIIRPIDSAGCYVPGGNYPLPSSALMTVIPAKLAGVNNVIVCTPPDQNGQANSYTVAAAEIAGADKIFKIGGSQAIAAMAYGAKNIPSADKIVGPGNKYVTAAKKVIYGDTGIDFLAGPSEIMVLSDGESNPEIIASDLIAQAEHDSDSRALLATTSRKEAEEVKKSIKKQLGELSNTETAENSLEKNGKILVVENIRDSIQAVNRVAPEHLELQVQRPKRLIPEIKNAGTIFIGEKSAEALGDYTTGTNHVLPTGGAARFKGGLSVEDFVKKISWERQTTESLKEISEIAKTMANIEGLEGHRNSIQRRIKNEH